MVSTEYLAGFMDGEGHLSLGFIPRRNRSTEYPVRVVVYNTDLGLLAEIRQTWGGTLSIAQPRNPRWKRQGALIWTNAEAASVLARVAPYLRIKSRHAHELLEFYTHLRSLSRTRDDRGRLLPLSEGELRLRKAVHLRLKRLNARGTPVGARHRLTKGIRVDSIRERVKPSLEYLAGIIDAEGSLMITKSKAPRASVSRYEARVSLSNTHRAVLVEVQSVYGGALVDQRRPVIGWKNAYQLVWTGANAEKLLRRVGSRLRIKREQSTVMLAFTGHRRLNPRVRGDRGFVPLSNKVLAFWEQMRGKVRDLNAKGPRPASREVVPSAAAAAEQA